MALGFVLIFVQVAPSLFPHALSSSSSSSYFSSRFLFSSSLSSSSSYLLIAFLFPSLCPHAAALIPISTQNAFSASAFSIVYPMSYFALIASIGLMPLVLYLAKMSEAGEKKDLL